MAFLNTCFFALCSSTTVIYIRRLKKLSSLIESFKTKQDSSFRRCIACPEGTFKPTSVPGDISSCSPCPGGERSWSPAGSTSEEQCTCQEGHQKQLDQERVKKAFSLNKKNNNLLRILARPNPQYTPLHTTHDFEVPSTLLRQ